MQEFRYFVEEMCENILKGAKGVGRARRIWVPHLFYHIVCRGNRRDPLFKETNDFRAFLHILEQLHEKYHLNSLRIVL